MQFFQRDLKVGKGGGGSLNVKIGLRNFGSFKKIKLYNSMFILHKSMPFFVDNLIVITMGNEIFEP